MLVLVSWLSALAVSDSPRSLFYQTLIALSGQGFFVAGLDHILCVSRCPIFATFSRLLLTKTLFLLSKGLIGKGPESVKFAVIEKGPRLKAIGILVGNI